jgi:predicted pyridoxine 5'-phosphate oxidase superfamily flavin-nucleotide-binding protein
VSDGNDLAPDLRAEPLPRGFDEWHSGERALQRIVGSEDMLAFNAQRILRPYMTDQLRSFFPLLPFVIVSFVDDEKQPWGTIIPGRPGFVRSLTPDTLRIERVPPAGDPFAAVLREGMPIGLLGIELPTRRRNRVNGVVSGHDRSGFTVTVQQAYGNCPKYIQQRTYVDEKALPERVGSSAFTGLDDTAARLLLSRVDTMFVASFAPGPSGAPSMDVSHRGGRPGFIRIEDDRLIVPDFSGNRFFNTLGNILLTGRAGFVVPCFETGDLLLLTGDAGVGLDQSTQVQAAEVGAERVWWLRPRQGHWIRGALPMKFYLESWSTNTLETRAWPESIEWVPAAPRS